MKIVNLFREHYLQRENFINAVVSAYNDDKTSEFISNIINNTIQWLSNN